ncbi:MAG: serine protease inhibitor [Eubacterium sp.]|jgi:serpin B|nr:serine protease inhibitor [Eubacterium sp.]
MLTKKFNKTVIFPILLAVIIIIAIVLLNITGNFSVVNAQELSKGVKSNNSAVEKLPDNFRAAEMDLSISLFKNSISQNKNSLISPLSVTLAMGMTANGAAATTLDQFKKLLGQDRFTIDEINKFNYSLSSLFQSDKHNKVRLANSIWYRNEKTLTVNPVFLQKNADFYKANIFKSDFTSKNTIKDINNWVKNNTDGMIDNIVDTIYPNTIMYLFNTVLFEAEWRNIYKSNEVYEEIFSRSENDSIGVSFMHSMEKFIQNKNAEGFIKPYKGDKYSFVGILPKENISLKDFITTLNGNNFKELVTSYGDEYAQVGIPKFKYAYSKSLVEPLKSLGFTDGFSPSEANFSTMASVPDGNIYISEVLHKTYIQVDEKGTKAGAATKVEMLTGSAMQQPKKVTFDRPFVFAIIENETQLPLFIGTVVDPKAE